MMISCGSGAIKKEECDVVVYGREVASVDAPSLSATPLVIVMVMVRRSGQPPASHGEKYKVKMAKIQSEIQRISYLIPLRRICTRYGSRQKEGTASRQKGNRFPPKGQQFPATSFVASRQKWP
jgi:hypothetical protein